MFQTNTNYDRGVNTFNPEGRLFQVEYAIEAIKLGTTAIGIKCQGGVVLAVEKRITSPLIEPSSLKKLLEIDSHVGCAMSGLTADARTLVDYGRVEAQNHFFTFDEPMRVSSVVQAICDKKIKFGHGGEDHVSRPYGVALLIAGVDKDGTPSLFHTDPSGTFTEYKAKSIGVGSEGAMAELHEKYSPDLNLAQAEELAMTILKQVMEEKVEENNVEFALVTSKDGFKVCSKAYVQEILKRIDE
jgi:20S proteasome subunit alpha 5